MLYLFTKSSAAQFQFQVKISISIFITIICCINIIFMQSLLQILQHFIMILPSSCLISSFNSFIIIGVVYQNILIINVKNLQEHMFELFFVTHLEHIHYFWGCFNSAVFVLLIIGSVINMLTHSINQLNEFLLTEVEVVDM